MTTELVAADADEPQDDPAAAQPNPELHHREQRHRHPQLPQAPASGPGPSPPMGRGGGGGGGDSHNAPPSRVTTANQPGRRFRPDYVSRLRQFSIDDSQQSNRLNSTPQTATTSNTQITWSRANRRTQMAFLEDIPKYAFGTTHTIVESDKKQTGDELEGSQSADSGSGLPSSTSDNTQQLNCVAESKFKALMAAAIRLGCRHFDCAPLYKTQPLVGQCLSEIMKQVPRQQLFITSKLPPNMMRVEHITRSISKSIEELQCCYLDLFLIHAPFATRHLSDDQHYPLDEHGQLQLDEGQQVLENAWRKLVELKKRGFTRYIGLSNVNMEQLIRLHAIHPVDVVQNEYHIYNQNRDLFDYCEELDVHFEAYACFGNPTKSHSDSKPNCMSDPILRRVARENGLSVAQAIIQWIHNQPLSYVIKCDNERQLEENLQATKLAALPVESLMELDSLDRGCRVHTFTEHKGLENCREYPFKDLDIEFVGPFQQGLRRGQRRRQQQQQNPSTSHYCNPRPWQPARPKTQSHNIDANANTNTNNNNNNNDDDDDDDGGTQEKIEPKHRSTSSTAASVGQITGASPHTINLNPVVSLGDLAATTAPNPPSSTA